VRLEAARRLPVMSDRIMYVQLKTGYNTDQGPAWIGWVKFSKSWQTAYFQGRTLRRAQGVSANFYDVETAEEFWVSGPKRDRTDPLRRCPAHHRGRRSGSLRGFPRWRGPSGPRAGIAPSAANWDVRRLSPLPLACLARLRRSSCRPVEVVCSLGMTWPDETGQRPPSAIDEWLDAARSTLARVTVDCLAAEVADGALVVDIRPVEQRRRDGELVGAVVVDRNVLEWRLDPTCAWRIPQAADPDRRVILVCDEGYSSSLAAATLQRLGLRHATDLVGGFQALSASQTHVPGAESEETAAAALAQRGLP
jgi:rhodanese-related sulfurtransferase